MDLRVTRRTLEKDLGLTADLLAQPVERFTEEHPILLAFHQMRSQNPEGQETTQLPKSKQVVYNLHAGRYRGLTWFDEDDDVCWLLGAGFHQSGSRSDAYIVLRNTDEAGDLLPTETDYRALYQWRRNSGASELDDLVRLVAQEGPELLSAAMSSPGARIGRILGDALEVEILVEETFDEGVVLRQYTVTFVMPPHRPGILPSGSAWQLPLIFAFLPHTAEIGDLEWQTDARGETVVFIEVEESPPF